MLYYITDHLGSTRLILDGSNGNIMERMTYTPMGRKWTASGSEFPETIKGARTTNLPHSKKVGTGYKEFA